MISTNHLTTSRFVESCSHSNKRCTTNLMGFPLKKNKKNFQPPQCGAKEVLSKQVQPGQTQFPVNLQVPLIGKVQPTQTVLASNIRRRGLYTLSIPATKCARCCLHQGSNLPPLKDTHGAVCTRSQTCTIVFLQPYRYYVCIAVACETKISSFPWKMGAARPNPNPRQTVKRH